MSDDQVSQPDDPSPAGSPPDGPGRPKKFHVAWLIFGGLLLAIGGCGMFLGTLNLSSSSTNPLSAIGGIGFGVGVLLFVGGIITAIVRAIASAAHKK
jgi:hypothetical protein